MDIQGLLKVNSERLHTSYHENIDDVLDLQTTLIRDILPSVVDELGLGPDATEWAREWLNDTASVFRILRRNKFTKSFALESIRKNLVWRLQNLWPAEAFVSPAVHCLPQGIRDPFGRPILVVEVIPIIESPEVIKRYIIQAFEMLRLHLKSLYGARAREEEEGPVLQYIILLDLAGLSLQSMNIDIMAWTIREVIPRFPGMLAGVFIINYSWAHSGLWSIVKRVLPESALSRVFFPTREDLLTVMTPGALPRDYGGALPFLTDLDDPLRPGRDQSSTEGVLEDEPSSSTSHQPTSDYISSISPTSVLNPFYGYPAASTRGYPQLHHGRRRKRDLARTLALLFWIRWRTHITAGVVLTAAALILNFISRRGLLRVPRVFFGWKASPSSAFRAL